MLVNKPLCQLSFVRFDNSRSYVKISLNDFILSFGLIHIVMQKLVFHGKCFDVDNVLLVVAPVDNVVFGPCFEIAPLIFFLVIQLSSGGQESLQLYFNCLFAVM